MEPKKSVSGIGGSSKAGRDGSKSRINDGKVDGNEVEDNEIRKKVQKLFKSKNSFKSKKIIGSNFLTPRVKLAFTKLRQVFLKVLILHHFDLERHIRIKTNALGYAIGGVLS